MAGLLEGNSGSKTQGMGTEPRLDPGLTWVSSCCTPKLPAHWVQVTSLAPAVPACRHPESPLPTSSPPTVLHTEPEISGSQQHSPCPFF